MEKANERKSLKNALRTVARSARRQAFRKGLPIAVTRDQKVVFIYKDNKSSPGLSSKRKLGVNE